MAQKKTSIYSPTQIDTLKRELLGVVEYLQALDLPNVKDVIDWKPTKTGVMPTIVSTEEDIIITAVGVIKQSAGIIIAVFETEGMSETLQYQIDVTVNKLNELSDFFFGKNLNDISIRYIEINNGFDKKGNPKIIRAVAATRERQIQVRGRITEMVQKIIPMIDTIKSYKTVTARGGVEITEAMRRYLKRLGK